MLIEETRKKLSTIAVGAAVTFEAIGWRKGLEMDSQMFLAGLSGDIKQLDAAGIKHDTDGTNMSAEVWILNTVNTPEALRILEASDIAYAQTHPRV